MSTENDNAQHRGGRQAVHHFGQPSQYVNLAQPGQATGAAQDPFQTPTNQGGTGGTTNALGRRQRANAMDEDDRQDSLETPTPLRIHPATQEGAPPSQPDFGHNMGTQGTRDDTGQPPRKAPRNQSTAASRAGSVAPSQPSEDPQGAEDDPTLSLTPEQAKKKAIDDLRASMRINDQEPDEGLVSFPRYTHARSYRSSNFWPAYLRNPETCALCAETMEKGGAVVWAQAYKTTGITQTEVDLFRWGLLAIEKNALVKDFKHSEYIMPTVPGDAKGIMILSTSGEATRRLLTNKILTFRSPSKSGTFFIQSNDSWGSHIIVDIHGGGTNFERDVLPHFWKTFGPYVLRPQGKPERESHVDLVDLAYLKVPLSDKTHEGSNAVIWRVRFKYTSGAMSREWSLPRSIGTSNRGMIASRKAPFCSHCVSYSHAQNCCEWWKEGLTAGAKTKPQNHQKTDWKKLPAVNPKKLLREAA